MEQTPKNYQSTGKGYEDLKKINDDWRRYIHHKSSGLLTDENFFIFGKQLSGKKSCFKSVFKALYPEHEDSTVKSENIYCKRLTDRIFLWKMATIAQSSDLIDQIEHRNGSENEKLPQCDLCVLLIAVNENDEEYFKTMRESIEYLRSKSVPFVIWITKVDLLSSNFKDSIGKIVEKISNDNNETILASLVLPIVNLRENFSLLKMYFVLRILAESLKIKIKIQNTPSETAQASPT